MQKPQEFINDVVRLQKNNIIGTFKCHQTDPLYWSVRTTVIQVAQLSQRDRAAGGLVFAESGRQHSADNIGLSSTTVT